MLWCTVPSWQGLMTDGHRDKPVDFLSQSVILVHETALQFPFEPDLQAFLDCHLCQSLWTL